MRKSLLIIRIILFSVIFFPWSCFAIEAWPGGSGEAIATYSDASGAVWNETRQSLFVVQNSGTLVELDSGGTFKDSWSIPGDLEGIALAGNDRYLYIGVEYPESILEFDTQTEVLTGKSWNLHGAMNGTASQGLEGLAYRDGHFLAGHQGDGKIYVFDVNLDMSGDVSFVQTITPNASYASDISGLEYNTNTGLTYVIYDTYDALLEMNSANEIVKHYSLPGTAQEGFAMKTHCMSRKADVYVTNDDSGIITKYADYPITCLDADGDGVNYATDCDDYDASISASQSYYRDADSDGLGANVATSFCSLTAPAGYVTNSSDQNDNDFDNDGVSAGTDCNDSDNSISSSQSYYRDADGDGLGKSTATDFCSLAVPVGYVTNNSDQNDNDVDNDGSATGVDCNDADNSISQNQTYYRDIDGDGLGDADTTTSVCSLSAPEGYVADKSDPADISSNGRYISINGVNLDLFGSDINTVEYTDLNYYGDDWQEVVAVGLVSKKAYITLARVRGSEVAVTKRVRVKIKKKHTSVSISTDSAKQKFTTRFARGKKFTWKVKSAGTFKKSK